VLGPTTAWPRDRRALVTGLILAGLLVLAIQTALMLVFDPRYVDFPFAGLIGALMPFVILALVPNQGILADGQTPRPGSAAGEKLASTGSTTEVGGLGSIRTQAETAKLRGSASIRPPAEKTAAVILALSAVYIVLAEGVANWQALSFSVALGVLALTLVRGRAEPD
jgi:glucan 1,3-beta-glucosidase